jgi:type III secretory pathway component EscR
MLGNRSALLLTVGDEKMSRQSNVLGGLAFLLAIFVALPVMAQEKKPEKKAEDQKADKAKAEKVAGDIGLLDTEKNYMIVVTKEGKLVTIDYNQKTKVTELKEKPAKMSDIGLGSAASVEYTKKGDKNVLTKIEFTPAKGGD